VTVTLTDASILAYANVVALIVPLFIIAILVDANKNGTNSEQGRVKDSRRRSSVKQSRRTLVSVAVGLITEVNSLGAILTSPDDDSGVVAPVNYLYVAVSAAGLLLILYVLFIPHIEQHISTIRSDASTGRWTLVVGWLADACIVLSGAAARFIGESTFNHDMGYLYFAIALMVTGSMITLSIFIARRRLGGKTVEEVERVNLEPEPDANG